MTNVGITGLGFMGMIHYLAYERTRGAKVKAICETHARSFGRRLADDQGELRAAGQADGPRGRRQVRRSSTTCWPIRRSTWSTSACRPTPHADAAIAALKAGKHVFCEKPIAMKPADAERMVKTARKRGKLLMIGHVLPFFAAYRFAYQTIKSQKYGKLLGAHFKRVISDPVWMTHYLESRQERRADGRPATSTTPISSG